MRGYWRRWASCYAITRLVRVHTLGDGETQVLTADTGISVNLLCLLFLTHTFFPRARSRTSKFFQMSYYNPESNMYGCGTDDLPFVAFWTVVFTGLRVVTMEYLLDPLARLGGIRTRKGLDRFKEQAWLIVYYTASWSLGMVCRGSAPIWRTEG
jgi:acyl-CoA-dependent ceramide synthase